MTPIWTQSRSIYKFPNKGLIVLDVWLSLLTLLQEEKKKRHNNSGLKLSKSAFTTYLK